MFYLVLSGAPLLPIGLRGGEENSGAQGSSRLGALCVHMGRYGEAPRVECLLEESDVKFREQRLWLRELMGVPGAHGGCMQEASMRGQYFMSTGLGCLVV